MSLYTLLLVAVTCICTSEATPVSMTTEKYDVSALIPCKASDQVCIDKIANDVYQLFMEGVPALGIEPQEPIHHALIEGDLSILKYNPALGIEPQEPIHHALIEGDLSILKYKFVNTTFIGLNKCKISNVKFYVKFQIPSIVGAIDGTPVAIIRPAQNVERFYNRKGFYSKNVLICRTEQKKLTLGFL